ncbi:MULTISPECIES: helix-turn-helix domain-containing protein [Arthrobacter]|nr:MULTISPECIES: helix-turn-helix domain-containing protein [Arthrobacter]MBT8163164.1 helix-turn-helix domain-containing protein [Arthrobacter sp. GN70]
MIDYTVNSADAWEALCVEQFQLCSLDWAAPSFDAGLRASASTAQLSLRMLTAGPFGVSRTARDIRRHDCDDLMVVLHDAGAAGRVEHKGRQSELRPGDAVIIDTTRPYAFDFPQPIQQAVLKVPHGLAGRLAPDAGRVFHASDGPLGRVLRTILREFAEIDEPIRFGSDQSNQSLEATSLAVAAVDLVSAMYASGSSCISGLAGQTALLKSGQDLVRTRFRDPALTPSLIAEHLRISPRLLARIFSQAGTTPASYIRDVRLEEAARLLRSSYHRDVPIFDVGLRVGFADPTTFTRAFKRVHGVVPSEFRAGARAVTAA